MAKVYLIENYISLTDFVKGLAATPLDYEIAHDSWRYPFVRLTLGSAKMVGCTDQHGNIVQLRLLGAEEDGHQQIIQMLSALFKTEMTEEDLEAFLPTLLR